MLKYGRVRKMPASIARYYTHAHAQAKPNPKRKEIFRNAVETIRKKGVTEEGLFKVKYSVRSVEKSYLFTRVLVHYEQRLFNDSFKVVLK